MQTSMQLMGSVSTLHSLPCRLSAPSTCACSTSYAPTPLHRDSRHMISQRGDKLVVRMGIRAVENFDATFELSEECRSTLTDLLQTDSFCEQVAKQTNCEEGRRLQFADVLFQPMPWSVNTKKGMPAEIEELYHDKPEYVIINIPPNFMFKAKIFKPARLAAVFRTAT